MKRSSGIVKAYAVRFHKAANSKGQDQYLAGIGGLSVVSRMETQEMMGQERGAYVRETPKVRRRKKKKSEWQRQKG